LEYTVFYNGFELVAALEKGKRFDLYCLDIIIPSFTEIETAKEIRRFDKNSTILFFTSTPDFALESYSVKAIDYVLKPITQEKLFSTFDDVLERLKIEENDDAIIVKSNAGIQKILIPHLVFAEVISKNVLYHLLSGKVIQCTESFASVCEKLLKYNCFIKTHRSYIMNMQYVDTIEKRQVILQTHSSIPIAQGKSKEIKERYLAFQMEEQ